MNRDPVYTKEEILDALSKCVGGDSVEIVDYVIGEEEHQDGGKHFHCLLVLNKKF